MKVCIVCGVSPGDVNLEYTPVLIGFTVLGGEVKWIDWMCTICVTASIVGLDRELLADMAESVSLTQPGVVLISAEDAAADNAEQFGMLA